MFKCQFCGTQVSRGVRPTVVVTATRPRVYSQQWRPVPNTPDSKAKWEWRKLPKSKQGGTRHHKPRLIEALIPQHTGWEIVQERQACNVCSKGRKARSCRPAANWDFTFGFAEK